MSESLIKRLTLRRLTKACPRANKQGLSLLVEHEYAKLYAPIEPLLLGTLYFVEEPLFRICLKKSKNYTIHLNKTRTFD